MASAPNLTIEQFLQALAVDSEKLCCLTRMFAQTFRHLAKNSNDQFLSTPITESLLPSGTEEGRYLAIDLGGSNLRVGFIELLGNSDTVDYDASSRSQGSSSPSRVNRLLERCWPIGGHLKKERAEDLFAWVGRCIAEVIGSVYFSQPNAHLVVLPLGLTYSFPMLQNTLADATLMPMGKGFAITSNLDLRKQLLAGYAAVSNYSRLPRLQIVAISNDAVATLTAFFYQNSSINSQRRPAMAFIVGTGNNATIPIAPNLLHPSKIPTAKSSDTDRIVINTEWGIKGSAQPLHELDLVTKWDSILDEMSEAPGFMPFEYMTSGRYLGELCRIIIVDYLLTQFGLAEDCLPHNLRNRNGLNTTFIGHLKEGSLDRPVTEVLKSEIPSNSTDWDWTEKTAEVVCEVARAVEKRAASMLAAAVVGLLACSGDIKLIESTNSCPRAASNNGKSEELLVGFTGGCITHFQEYLRDCQDFVNTITAIICEGDARILLEPCHDGGIIGAGILAGKIISMRKNSGCSHGTVQSNGFLSEEEEDDPSSSSGEDDHDNDADVRIVPIPELEMLDAADE